MKYKLIVITFYLLGCHSSNQVKDLIQGKWVFDKNFLDTESYIKITDNEYIVENDSPFDEDYLLVGDTMLLKGFEASYLLNSRDTCHSCSFDTSKILKITKNKLVLLDHGDTLFLHRK